MPLSPSTSPGAESARAAGRVAAEAAARAAAGGGISQLWNSGEVAADGVVKFPGFARLVDSQWISFFWVFSFYRSQKNGSNKFQKCEFAV